MLFSQSQYFTLLQKYVIPRHNPFFNIPMLYSFSQYFSLRLNAGFIDMMHVLPLQYFIHITIFLLVINLVSSLDGFFQVTILFYHHNAFVFVKIAFVLLIMPFTLSWSLFNTNNPFILPLTVLIVSQCCIPVTEIFSITLFFSPSGSISLR